MPQMKVEKRYSSELRKKNDATESNCVTYEIRDESSPECSPPLNGFLQNVQLVKSDPSQDSYDGSKHEDKILSVLSKNPNPALSDLSSYPSNVVNDIKSANVVNGHCSNDEDSNANKGDIKSSLFSDSLVSSLTCKPNKEDNMKIINGCNTQVFGDFSDLLSSISTSEQVSKGDSEGNLDNFEVFNGHGVNNELPKSTSYKRTNFTTGNKDNLSDIFSSSSCTEFNGPQQNSSLNCTKPNGPEINNGELLDILSSISFDETDASLKNPCSSSLNFSHSITGYGSNELMSEFSFLNSHENTSNSTPSELQNNGSLSDMLSSINFNESHKNTANEHRSTTLANPNLENDSLLNLKELSTEFLDLKCCTPKDKCFNNFSGKLNDATDNKSNIDELLHSSPTIDSKTTDPVNSFTNDEKRDFSFFSVSPDSVFSSMLTNLHSNLKQQDKDADENTDNISMLDLLKSVNTDSSSSLSGYLDIPSKTKELQYESEDLNKILDIDLSTCVKTSENADNVCQDLPVNDICKEVSDTSDVKPVDYIEPVFEEVDSNRPRVNKSQSLFAKALSCKPKRNPELLRKAIYVKSELYKLYFNRVLGDNAELDKNFKIKEDIYTNTEMVVCETSNCMITFKGRRFCPREVN